MKLSTIFRDTIDAVWFHCKQNLMNMKADSRVLQIPRGEVSRDRELLAKGSLSHVIADVISMRPSDCMAVSQKVKRSNEACLSSRSK